jgi:hypothetical protein
MWSIPIADWSGSMLLGLGWGPQNFASWECGSEFIRCVNIVPAQSMDVEVYPRPVIKQRPRGATSTPTCCLDRSVTQRNGTTLKQDKGHFITS